ncbi:MAG: SAM-dependent chlorinase/fluorinase [Candidatus Latescibacterota bacterium]
MTGRQQPAHVQVALLSDFGQESFYVGIMKAVIHHAAPGSAVVDITHDISPFAIDQASFILKTIVPFLPAGTVFVAVVDPQVGGSRENRIFQIEERYLLAPDNGLVTDVSGAFRIDASWRIDEVTILPYRIHPGVGSTFLGRDVFAPAAGAIACGISPAELGRPAETAADVLTVPIVECAKHRIEGYGRYIDRFGNILTGITGDQLEDVFGDDAFNCVTVHVGERSIRGVRHCYADEPRGTLMVILNSWNILEVSVSQGRADEMLSVSNPCDLHIILGR